VRAKAGPGHRRGLGERVQLSVGASELRGRRGEVCRREEPSSYEAGLRAHGSNHRFHRLLGHAVARALTTAPRLTGLGPAAPGILILQGWRRKRRPGRCCTNKRRWDSCTTPRIGDAPGALLRAADAYTRLICCPRRGRNWTPITAGIRCGGFVQQPRRPARATPRRSQAAPSPYRCRRAVASDSRPGRAQTCFCVAPHLIAAPATHLSCAASGSWGGRRRAASATRTRLALSTDQDVGSIIPARRAGQRHCRRASAGLPSPPTAALSRASLAWPAAASPAIRHLPPTGCQAPGAAASLPLPALRPVGSRPAR
jgi:hypothetical protein